MMEMQPMDSVLNEIKKLALSVEVHLKKVSDKYETLDTKIAFEYYRQAYFKEDTFKSYRSFDPELLVKWGITQSFQEAQQWGKDPTLIPEPLQDLVLMYQRQYVIDTYVELNEYIRVKIGLPTLAEMDNKEFVYASDSFYENYEMSKIPLHEMSDIDIVRLRKTGELDRIISENPSKKYLKYIGDSKLDIFKLKSASNFELMRVDEKLDRKLLSEFTKLYEQSRTYMVNVTYVSDYSNRYTHYDSYMGLLILTMTIQRLCVNTFKVGIDRDFYDLTNLKMLFESYNMPFINDLPIDYQRVLARNLNRLLRYKSSDRVLYDVAEILGFNSAEFYKYFLVKQHKFVNGEPVFAYKTVTDEEGQEHQEFNYEQMYDIYFQGVNMREVNESTALTDTSNRISYADMTIDDEFWWEGDDELRKILYETEYNIIESKYIGVHIMYRLTEMIHEVARFFRLVIDNSEAMRTIWIRISKIKSEVPLSYLETIVLAICLICKRNNMRGEIITTPSKTLSVLGFNFRADFNLIRQQLDENRDLIEHEKIYNLIKDLSMNTVEDINRVYGNIKELWNFLIDKMSRAKTIEEFNAYEKLYKTLHYTDDLASVFTMSNGKIAETYLEYLEDLNEDLALFVEGVSEQTILVALENIIYALEDEIESLQYLNILNEGNTIMVDALKTLVLFFKSYTIDLKHLSIIYVMDNRYYNMIKLISQIKLIEANLTVGDTLDKFTHKLHLLVNLLQEDDIKMLFTSSVEGTILLESLAKLTSKIILSAESTMYDDMRITTTEFLSGDVSDELIIYLKDDKYIYSEVIGIGKISGTDEHKVNATATIADNIKLNDVSDNMSKIWVSDNTVVLNKIKSAIESIVTLKELLSFKDNFNVHSLIDTAGSVAVNDVDHTITGIDLVQLSQLNDKYRIHVLNTQKSLIEFRSAIQPSQTNIDYSHKSTLFDIADNLSKIMLDMTFCIYESSFIFGDITQPYNINLNDRVDYSMTDSKSSLGELTDVTLTNATIKSDALGRGNNNNLLSKHELLIIREE